QHRRALRALERGANGGLSRGDAGSHALGRHRRDILVVTRPDGGCRTQLLARFIAHERLEPDLVPFQDGGGARRYADGADVHARHVLTGARLEEQGDGRERYPDREGSPHPGASAPHVRHPQLAEPVQWRRRRSRLSCTRPPSMARPGPTSRGAGECATGRGVGSTAEPLDRTWKNASTAAITPTATAAPTPSPRYGLSVRRDSTWPSAQAPSGGAAVV